MTDIVKSLSIVQQEIKVKKDAKNHFAKYEYRTLETILENYKKTCKDLGAIVIFTERVICEIQGVILLEATAHFRIADKEITTNAITEIDYNHKGMSKEQIWGTASTYAKKRAVSSLLCLDDSADDPDSLAGMIVSGSLVDEIKNLAKIKNVAIEQILKCEKLKSLENAKTEQLQKILDNLRS